ncbi:MAG: ABC transporter substrate-binding protein [Deltaproteobacteria bacterium]|nr:ABC transporter substrate-binding protein [Deltaproteobacteria bacterium]MBW1929672.1 ABC transporter substrate-binding protein [Deltaproteobacteria bacterium]MBW2025259.1 ABC transporter substrate-binding protein [Deltaproteobacteria bacterium]MBW2125163.1 ABC transporter substrate-binding protein [Deltaproteobacteria bacterium]RLB24860.1 MAG: branched-chain amino acid ABC transporter substrate-binding protein [Deltaproteobacteria bacterium]
MMKKTLLFLLVVALCLFTSLGYSGSAQTPYKIGAILSLSGRGALLGIPEKKTIEMLVEQVNSRGGIHGHPIKLIILDDGSKKKMAAEGVKRLIEEEDVLAIIGPSLSGTSLAVFPIAEASEVPLISCAASYKIVTANREAGEQYKWIFKTPQSDSLAVLRIYTHMKKRGISRIAILTAKTEFGESGREELTRLAPGFGMSIVAQETYGPRQTSMVKEFRKIKQLSCDGIINWSVGPTQIIALYHWREMGLSVIPFYQSHGFGSPRNIALAGNAGEGVFCPLGPCMVGPLLPENHPQKQVIMAYRKAFRERYGEEISSFGGHAWDAFSLLVDALKTVGPIRPKIREHLEFRRGFVGQHGVFNFSPLDHNGLSIDSFVMVVVKDGKWALAE